MPRPLIIQALINPLVVQDIQPRDWESLIVQGRVSRLLGRLDHVLNRAGLVDSAPERARDHLVSSRRLITAQHAALLNELSLLKDLFAPLGVRPVVLKGAAYVLSGLESGRGRIFSDIDILVPKARLQDIEVRLLMDGWISSHRDNYDQRYYREWMHEIPPMIHAKRGTCLDVHHALTPSTSRIRANSSTMLEAAQETPSNQGIGTLAATDMVLHSATHLFLESEWQAGLRDLSDLHALITEFTERTTGFQSALAQRAIEVGLALPLFYAMRYLKVTFDTSLSPEPLALLNEHAPRIWQLKSMDWIFSRAFMPDSDECRLPLTNFALYLLYLRGHWLRMPTGLLIQHLATKAWMDFKRRDTGPDE